MKLTAWFLGTILVLTGIASGLAVPARADTIQVASTYDEAEIKGNTINPTISVRGTVVRISDIFNGPIPRGDRAILAAPAPGERSILDATLLSRIARLYGLDWKPMSRDIRVIVKRDSITLSHAEILAELRPALEAIGAPKDAEIRATSASLAMTLPAEATPTLDVGQVQYDARTHIFSAMVDVTATADGRVVFTQQMPVSGRAFATERVPVLTSTIDRGEIIQPDNVTYVSLRSNLVRDGAITDAFSLIGKQARRQIKDGAPIKTNQVRNPVLVDRGDMVVIYYALKTMNLTAKGKALDAGGQGDVIRVLNTKSNRTLMAKIVQPNQVVVDVITQTALR
ncbi:MAG: flagellar basal body P-ring formation protein FlgA [Rhodospirillaceae bacterium]|nr:flagellar basal body P-ring formation protein FlgA [Rhodospirillaceae bacterium]